MATESKASVGKVKPINQLDNSSKGKLDPSSSSLNRKKIDGLIKQQPKSSSAITKTEVKSKTTSGSSKTTTKTTTRVRQKKVFTLAGQKYDPPEEREPLRIFYESLSKQIPTSEMAEFWMMEHGLLSPDRAKKAFDKKQRKQKQLWTGTPAKSPQPQPLSNKPGSSQKQHQGSKVGDMKAKRRVIDDTDDDDFILSPKRRKG